MDFKFSLNFYEFEKGRLISSRKISRYGEVFSDIATARAAAVEEARKEFWFDDLDGCPVEVTEKVVDGAIHIRKSQEILDGSITLRITVEEDAEPYYTLPPDEDEQSVLQYRTEIRGLWPTSEMSESEDEFFIAKWGGADGITAIKTCPAGHEVRRVVVQNEDDVEYDDWIAVPTGTKSPKEMRASDEEIIAKYQAIKAWWYNEDGGWCEPVLSLYRGEVQE